MASRSFGTKSPAMPHLVKRGGGLSGEIADLRSDIDEAFTSLEEDVTDVVTTVEELEESLADGGQGFIYVSDITTPTPGGSISNKQYADPPANLVLIEATSSSSHIYVHVVSSYPSARVVTTVDEYTKILTPTGLAFTGYVDVYIGEADEIINVHTVTPNGSNAAKQTVDMSINLPPELIALSFSGDYPELSWNPGTHQTALAAGNTFNISFTSDRPCVGARVLDQDACVLQTFTFAETTSGIITATIADRGDVLQELPAWVQVKDSGGAYGAARSTNHNNGGVHKINVVDLNNLVASGSIGTITYRSGYSALKNSEYADIAVTASNYDEVLFDENSTGELSITSPTVFASSKEVQRIDGITRFTGTNFRMHLRRLDNGRETIINGTVQIANVPISSVIVGVPAARLRSGGNDSTSAQNHTITITLDQPIISAPSLTPATDGGTFIGSWAGGPSVWTRSLQVHDNNLHQLHTWGALSVINKAGLETTVITSGTTYTIGGFVIRTLLFSVPFSQTVVFNAPVGTYTKLSFGTFSLGGDQAIRNPVQGNHDNITNNITVDSIGTNPTTAFLNDQVLANNNSQGLLSVTIQETV
jgi:hypothetical protein